eukprot:4021-Heterococcus_DN1.PRE.1
MTDTEDELAGHSAAAAQLQRKYTPLNIAQQQQQPPQRPQHQQATVALSLAQRQQQKATASFATMVLNSMYKGMSSVDTSIAKQLNIKAAFRAAHAAMLQKPNMTISEALKICHKFLSKQCSKAALRAGLMHVQKGFAELDRSRALAASAQYSGGNGSVAQATTAATAAAPAASAPVVRISFVAQQQQLLQQQQQLQCQAQLSVDLRPPFGASRAERTAAYLALQQQYTASLCTFVQRDGQRLLRQAQEQPNISSGAKLMCAGLSEVLSDGAEALTLLNKSVDDVIAPHCLTLEFLSVTLQKLQHWKQQCTAATVAIPVVPVAVPVTIVGTASAVGVLKADSDTTGSSGCSSSSSCCCDKVNAQSATATTSSTTANTGSVAQALAAVVEAPQPVAAVTSATVAVNPEAAAPVTLSDALRCRQLLTAYKDSLRQTLQSSSSAEEQLQQLQWLSDIAAQQAPAPQCCDAVCAHLSTAAAADLRTLTAMRKFVHDVVSTASADAAAKVQRVSFIVRCKLSTDW